jgi:hypothetical protein
VMNREQLQLQIAIQSCAITGIQQRLRSRVLSAGTRQKFENELLDRIHLRFVALNALRLMTRTTDTEHGFLTEVQPVSAELEVAKTRKTA